MAGRDLERACAKVLGHILVSNHRDFPAQDWNNHLFPDEASITFIVRMHRHCSIARNGLRASGCHRDVIPAAISQHVFEMIELSLFLGIFHFQVRNSRLQTRRPVDHARTLVDQPFFIQLHKSFPHRTGQTFIQGETLAIPIARCAQPSELVDDLTAILLFPLPDACFEGFAPDCFTRGAFFAQQILHLQLRGNASVISPRHPQSRLALHAVVTDHDVFRCHEQGVPQV